MRRNLVKQLRANEKVSTHVLLQFFNNHGLLNITDRPQWYTIKGGSSQYIPPLIAPFESKIKPSTAVLSVAKSDDKWQVTDSSGNAAMYDHVVFACHSDQALKMIHSPTAASRYPWKYPLRRKRRGDAQRYFTAA